MSDSAMSEKSPDRSAHTSAEDDDRTTQESLVLGRKIGLAGSIGIVIGTVVGSGIFISPKWVADAAGSEGMALLIWGVAGLISVCESLSLSELSSLIPLSAGEYNYLRAAYPRWLGFLYGWTLGVLVIPSTQAVVATTCAEYVLVPVYSDGCGPPPQAAVKMLAVLIILLLTATSCYSVNLSNAIQVTFMFGKIIALAIIIGGGIYMMTLGHLDNLKTGFEGTNKEPGRIMMGFYSAMFAYDGWANVIYVTEEIINPRRNIPLTFLTAIPLVTILYLLTNVSYFTVISAEEMIASSTVAITWAEIVIPKVSWLIPLCVAMATFGTVNGSISTTGRLLFVMAREKEMPQIVSYIHCRRKTPMAAGVMNCILAVTYILASSVVSLIDFLSFVTWLFIAFIHLSVIVLRFTMKDAPRSYKVPLVFPLIVFLFAMSLVIVPVVDSPQIEFLYATLIMLSGLIFYIPIVVFDKRAGCMRQVTEFFQLLIQVCPPTGTAGDEFSKTD